MLRNGLYNAGGLAVRGAVSLLTIPLLIRFLGIGGYGVWSLAYAVLALISMAEAGISVAAAVFVSQDLAGADPIEIGKTLGLVAAGGVLLSAAAGLSVWLAGPFVVRALTAFDNAARVEAGRAVQIAGLAAAVYILERTLVGIEQALDRYRAINLLDVLQSLLANIGFVVVALLGGRAIAMMRWQACVFALVLAAHICFVSRLFRGRRVRLDWSWDKAKRIFRFSAATWASAIGSAAFGQCDRLIVGGVLGPPALGVYSAVTNMTAKINSFSGMAAQPLVPSLSRGATGGSPPLDSVREATQLNAIIAVEAGILLFIFADWVMKVMVPGADARTDILGLQVAATIYTLYSFSAPGYFVLFSLGEAWANARAVLGSAIISLGLIFLGATYFGLLGSITGNAGYLGTLIMVGMGLAGLKIPFRRYLSWIAVPLLCLVVSGIAGMALRTYPWLRVGIFGLQAGAALLWFLHQQRGSGWPRLLRGSALQTRGT